MSVEPGPRIEPLVPCGRVVAWIVDGIVDEAVRMIESFGGGRAPLDRRAAGDVGRSNVA